MSQVQRVPIYVPERRRNNNAEGVGQGLSSGMAALAGMLFQSSQSEKERKSHEWLTLEAQKRANEHDTKMNEALAELKHTLLYEEHQYALEAFDHKFKAETDRFDAQRFVQAATQNVANLMTAKNVGAQNVLTKNQAGAIEEFNAGLMGKRNELLKRKGNQTSGGIISGSLFAKNLLDGWNRQYNPQLPQSVQAGASTEYELPNPPDPSKELSPTTAGNYAARGNIYPGDSSDTGDPKIDFSRVNFDAATKDMLGEQKLRIDNTQAQANYEQERALEATKKLLIMMPEDGSGYKKLLGYALAGDSASLKSFMESPEGREGYHMLKAMNEHLGQELRLGGKTAEAIAQADIKDAKGRPLLGSIDPAVRARLSMLNDRVGAMLVKPDQEYWNDAIINTAATIGSVAGPEISAKMVAARMGDYAKSVTIMLNTARMFGQDKGLLADGKYDQMFDKLNDLVHFDSNNVGPLQKATLDYISSSELGDMFEKHLVAQAEKEGMIPTEDQVGSMPGDYAGTGRMLRAASQQNLLDYYRGIRQATPVDTIEEITKGGSRAGMPKPTADTSAPIDVNKAIGEPIDPATMQKELGTLGGVDTVAPPVKAEVPDISKNVDAIMGMKAQPTAFFSPDDIARLDAYHGGNDNLQKITKSFVDGFDSLRGIKYQRAQIPLMNANDRRPYATAMASTKVDQQAAYDKNIRNVAGSLRQQSEQKAVQSPVTLASQQQANQAGPVPGQPQGQPTAPGQLKLQQVKPVTI